MEQEECSSETMSSLSLSQENNGFASLSQESTSRQPQQPQLSLEKRFNLIRSIGEECIEEEELVKLLEKKSHIICYDGFEPSGRMHIAQAVMKALNVKKLISAGCKVKIWIADWFALLNRKMGSDSKKIQVVGEYMIEIWKALGMNVDGGQVEFLWASKEINSQPHEYWPLVCDIATRNTVNRITRCCQIMGHSETDELLAAHIIYPCMQCADIFFLKADICQLGMDQREVNMLAREYCDEIRRKHKPIILSHHMLPGLQEGQEKMSKSDPSSSIFMEDEEADVNLKIKKAFCPPRVVEKNPCLEYIKYIVFPWFNEFRVERKAENGGDKTFMSFDDLVIDYESGELHPGDLKPALARSLNSILQPVRDHFNSNLEAKKLLKKVKSYKSTQKGVVVKPRRMQQEECSSETMSLLLSRESNGFASLSQESTSHQPKPQLSLEKRFNLIRSIGEECIQDDELERLLAKKPHIICYDGFEPSGRMHIGQGVMKTLNVKKLISAGCKVKILIADWFALMNGKMGGDLKKIQVVGQYMIEIWKAVGMNVDGGQVEFLWSSKELNSQSHEYWPLVIDIAIRNTLNRILRCCQIMGRSEKDELSAAQIFYPCMQCADVFFLKADICQLGMDQRKVNMLAREYCDEIGRKNKPIILSHHMLPGLREGQEKMSKSDLSSSIFMEDEEADVNLKINKAFCPPRVVEKNPCLEYIKYLIFPWFNEFMVERKAENGGDKTFTSFDELVIDYESGELHPGDLKPALAKSLNSILQPVRDHFNNNPEAKELLEKVKSYRVTR